MVKAISAVHRLLNRLNQTQLKVIALALMTIDHVAAYGSTMFSFLPLDLFRIIGRIAAPLFMFALVNGLMHTRSKKRFMLRLYIADLITVAVFTPGMLTGYMSAPRILPTYLYVAIYCFLIEKAADKFKSKRASGLLYIAAVAAVTVIPVLIDQTVIDWMCATVNHSSTICGTQLHCG